MSFLLELILAVVLMIVATVVHGTGIGLLDRIFQTRFRKFGDLRLARREISVMVPMALYLLGLHSLEIVIFATFYLVTGDAGTFREALYHSALAYTTMGVVEGGLNRWAIISTFEGLVGFLLIGWSSAVFVTDMERVIRRHV
jgi:hypothetical protein